MSVGKFVPVLCILLGLLITVNKGRAKTCNCGRWNPRRIVNGLETLDHEYPMMAGMVYIPKRITFCGCSIISIKHLLTAAHCFNKHNYPKVLAVSVGIDDLDTVKNSEVDNKVLFQVEKFKKHPDYRELNNNYDIAIVTLQHKIEYSMNVAPICLPFITDGIRFFEHHLRVLGWGLIKPYNLERSRILLKLDTTEVETEKCHEVDKNLDLNNVVCTISGRSGSCKYDGGGPVMFFNNTAHRWVLIGVITIEGCGQKPSVNMRVQNFIDFIISTTSGYNLCNIYN